MVLGGRRRGERRRWGLAAVIAAACTLSLLAACGEQTGGGASGDAAGSASPSASVSALPVVLPDEYVNERFGFSVKYDAELFELKEEPGEEGAVAVVMESAGDAVGPPAAALVVAGPLESGTGEAGSSDTLVSLKGNLPRLARNFGVTVEGGVEETTVGGLPGATAEISGPLPVSLEGEGLYGRMSMTAWDGNAMIVIEGAARDDWPRARETTLTRLRIDIDAAVE